MLKCDKDRYLAFLIEKLIIGDFVEINFKGMMGEENLSEKKETEYRQFFQ